VRQSGHETDLCATPCNSTTEPVIESTSTVIVPIPENSTKEPAVEAMLVATVPTILPSNSTKEPIVRAILDTRMATLSNSTTEPVVGDMLVATALSMAIPSNCMKEPVAAVTPVVTVPESVTVSGVTPLPEVPATLPPTDTRALPAGLEELPLDAPTRQDITHGPSVKETQDPASTKDELALIAMTRILTEEVAPLATPVVTRETNVGKLYDAQNPQSAATLSKLTGNYHSDRTVGFHRSPRIDNSGPLSAMMINGRVVNNLVLDCGDEAIITGQPSAAAMGITPTMIERGAIVIQTATRKLVRLDQTREPVSFTLNPGTADEVTVMAQVVIVKYDLPDTLIAMSIIGPFGLKACFHKQHLKYYIDWGTPNARKAFFKCQFFIDSDAALPDAIKALIAYTGAVVTTASMKSASNQKKMLEMPRSITTLPAQSLQEVTALFDRSVRVLAPPAEPMLPIAHPAYLHIRPLDVGMVEKRTPMSDTSTGMVVVELFSGNMATTEALLRQGVRIQTVYACKGDATSRLIDTQRLALFHTIYPEQLSEDAIRECHSHLPAHAIQITWGHVATMVRPDLVVASFPGQGFSHTSEKASLGLRDARTLRDLEEAVRVIHLIDSLWPGSPCAYLFETVDVTNYPQEDVRDKFNNVVKRILGPGVFFEPLAVSSDAYRTRRLWTNLAPAPLISEMIQEADSYAFHTLNDSSMAHPGTLGLWDDPYALGTERERQWMDNSTWIGPSVTEVDSHFLLKSTVDMHALIFTIGSAMCFQNVFFPAWDSTILAAQHTLRPDSVSLQEVAKLCQEGKLARGTLKKVSPTKVDAHSTIPLQEPAPDEVLGQAPPGLGGGLGQIDDHVNDDPSEEHDASSPNLINDNGEEGDGPSTDWDMGDHLTVDPKSKRKKLLAENRNVFTFTMDNMTMI
jgi:hypothetical protein